MILHQTTFKTSSDLLGKSLNGNRQWERYIGLNVFYDRKAKAHDHLRLPTFKAYCSNSDANRTVVTEFKLFSVVNE